MDRLEQAYQHADEFKRLVHERTGLKPEELQCPREKSEITPCIARDGQLAVAEAREQYGNAVCVGCETSVLRLLEKERAKHSESKEKPGGEPPGQ